MIPTTTVTVLVSVADGHGIFTLAWDHQTLWRRLGEGVPARGSSHMAEVASRRAKCRRPEGPTSAGPCERRSRSPVRQRRHRGSPRWLGEPTS